MFTSISGRPETIHVYYANDTYEIKIVHHSDNSKYLSFIESCKFIDLKITSNTFKTIDEVVKVLQIYDDAYKNAMLTKKLRLRLLKRSVSYYKSNCFGITSRKRSKDVKYIIDVGNPRTEFSIATFVDHLNAAGFNVSSITNKIVVTCNY